MKKKRILVVDDEAAARELISDELEEKGYEPVVADEGNQALMKFKRECLDLVLLDLKLPDVSGLKVLEQIRRTNQEIPIILFSAYGTVDVAVKAMKLGAYDFIEKPIDIDHLMVVIRNALEQSKLKNEVKRLKEEIENHYKLIGSSDIMQTLRDSISKAASCNEHVLITGETGSGKDLVARAIHNFSERESGPFIKVNCAAIPQELVESELFGYKKGAFTGAQTDKAGRIEIADGGSVFFDEIGEMNTVAQAKLLHFLESNEVERLGETRPKPVDVRVIAATNKDLSESIEEGAFRKDLYYRLNVIDIQVPHLAMHKEDIPELVDHFINAACVDAGIPVKQIEEKAIRKLAQHSWPGNVRQLRNYIRKLVSMIPAITITQDDLPELEGEDNSIDTDSPFQAAKQEFERSFIGKVLEEENHNIARASRRLGLNRSYLYRKIKELQINKKG